MNVRFVSLFSGVGGLDLGAEAAGWQCVAQVEWDKECQAVLAHRWPDVPKWLDVSDVNGAELPAADVVTFGSPCQDLSVAGRRAGFDGKRSVLFFEATRIIREMRESSGGKYPRFAVWENVAGALSSSAGRDFGAVLDELAELGALDIAWRVLDARWTGVAQRRRRVFVVADLAGECAGEILALAEGVQRDFEARRAARPITSGRPRGGAPLGGGTFDLSVRGRDGGADVEITEELAAALRAGDGGSSRSRAVFVNALDTMRGGADDNSAQAGHLVIDRSDVEHRGELRWVPLGTGGTSGDRR